MQVHGCHNMLMLFISLYFILVSCVVCISVPFTELHEQEYTLLLLLWYECIIVYQQSEGTSFGLHSIGLPSFVHISPSISELHVSE